MIRRFVSLLLFTAVLLGLVTALTATGASAAPAPKLRLVAATVTVSGPVVNPIGPADCMNIHVFSSCGTVTVTTTISGFDAYGGIDSCLPWQTCGTDDHYGYFEQYGTVGLGSAKLVLIYRCGTTGPLHVLRATLYQQVVWQGYASSVSGVTRVDSNTAKLSSVYLFPSPSAYSPACPNGKVTIVRGVVYNFVVGIRGDGGVADQTWHKTGYYAVPLPA